MEPITDPHSVMEKAVSVYQSGDLPAATGMVQVLVDSEPDNDSALSLLGSFLLAQQRTEEAQQYLERAFQLNPQNTEAIANLSALYGQQNRVDEALRMMESILPQIENQRPDILFNYSNMLVQQKRYADSIHILEKVLNLQPDFLPALNTLGALYAYENQKEKAITVLRRLLALQPTHIPSILSLGSLLVDMGQNQEARALYEQVLAIDPNDPQAQAFLGKLYIDLLDYDKAKELLQKAATFPPNAANCYVLLGNIAKEENDKAKAEEYYQMALNIDPDNQGALQNLRRLFNRSIPQWHFTMLADDARNEVYQKALEKAIRPSDLVLDIGAGSGLLSMMAARAGARQVVACEMQPMLAKAATQIVADNQFADRIQVHALKSLQLSVGRELSEPVDLIVSEILDCGGLGEAVLPSVRHAVNHLAKPDVRIIPSRLVLHAQLMEIPSRSRVVPVRDICGFDLSAFDRFRVPNEYIRIDLGAEDYKPLSDVVQFEDIDFYNMPPAYADDDPLRKNLDFSIQQSGQLQAVVFWFDLYLDDELKVSSGLGGELVHWGQALYCFERPTEVVAGAQLSIKMLRSDQMIRFAL